MVVLPFLLLLAAMVPVGDLEQANAQTPRTTDLLFLVDGSGSISAEDWRIQKDGYSAALQDVAVVPTDGTIAVGVVQWASGITRVEIPLTVVDSSIKVTDLVSRIRGISQIGGSTNPGDGVRTGTGHLLGSGRASSSWTLCMSTDGTTNSGEALGTAVPYAQSSGVDKYSVIGIEDPPFVTANILSAHYGPHVFGGGTVTVARNAAEFATLIAGGCFGDPVELRALEVNQGVQDWHNSVPLVADRATAVRAFVQVRSGGTPQRVAGRLFGTRDGVALPGSPLVAVNRGSSTLANQNIEARRGILDDSLNFVLPSSWRSGAVELKFEAAGTPVECREPSGPGADVAGDCRTLGTFRREALPEITFIGVSYRDGLRIVAPSGDELYEQMRRVNSLFPVPGIDYDLQRFAVPDLFRPSLELVNLRLATKRLLDRPSDAARYYGVLRGEVNGTVGLANGIPGKVASGFLSGLGRRQDAGGLRNVTAHELGHDYGRHHAVDGARGLTDGHKTGYCREGAAASAPDFPLFHDLSVGRRPVLGPLDRGADDEVWGLDNRFVNGNVSNLAVVDPRQTFELMSYCFSGPQGLWPSRFAYEGLRGRFFTPSAVSSVVATGDELVLVRGTIDLTRDKASLQPVGVAEGPVQAVPAGSYRARLLDQSGNELAGANFEPVMTDPVVPPGAPQPDPTALILVPLPKPAATISKISITHDGVEIGSTTGSPSPPTLTITSPVVGESFSGDTVTFTWRANDPDGDPLTFNVLYSADDGATWQTLTLDLAEPTLTIERDALTASGTALLRVDATDGVHTSSATSGRFSVANNAPLIEIESPTDNDTPYSGVQNVLLEASAFDKEDGPLAGSDISWASSIDGPLGSGDSLVVNASDLTEGRHVLSAKARDDAGATATKTVTIEVFRVAPPPGDPGGSGCTLTGTAGDDTLVGTAGDDVICGLAGNDRLVGLGGNDQLFGDEGDDSMDGGAGVDELRGGAGADAMFGAAGDDVMYGEAGNDRLRGGTGNDGMDGGTDNDQMFGFDGNDRLFGNAGNDRLFGEAGRDRVLGGAGDDVVDGGADVDDVRGGAGNDVVDGRAGQDSVQGETGNDRLFGGDDQDRLFGGSGNDALDGGPADDRCDGGTDVDTGVNCEVLIDIP
jgi:Ca2+-binding RTX toxin-like protein